MLVIRNIQLREQHCFYCQFSVGGNVAFLKIKFLSDSSIYGNGTENVEIWLQFTLHLIVN